MRVRARRAEVVIPAEIKGFAERQQAQIDALEKRLERLSQDLDDARQGACELRAANGFMLRRIEYLEQMLTQHIGPQL